MSVGRGSGIRDRGLGVGGRRAAGGRRWAILILYPLSFILFILTACTSVAPVVKIGLVAPFEGEGRTIGYDAIFSARLAVREINQAGGIGGYRIALVALDDGGQPSLAQATAESLALDPQMVAVLGHWLPQTSTIADDVYAAADLPYLRLGHPPFIEQMSASYPTDFLTGYAAVSPFDEAAGAYAGPTYDAFQLLFAAMRAAEAETGVINRQTVADALQNLTVEGITGEVYQNE